MSPRLALILCLLLAALFGAVSFTAVLSKSPTVDEPEHFIAGYAHVFLHDDRLDPENPLLWKWWSMLPIRAGALSLEPGDPGWRRAGEIYPDKESWLIPSLFSGSAPSGLTLINRSRFAMMLLGVLLCMGTAWWAWQVAGPWAAVAAAALFALDPTCLAHASLIKNDVAMSLAMLLAVIALWRAGRKLTWWNSLAIALACAAAINVKFSALLLPAIIALALLSRAMMREPWDVFGRPLGSRLRRSLVVPGALALIVAATFAVTWAAYGFRYAPSNDPDLGFPLDEPFTAPSDRLVNFAADHRLLPQAFCVGLLRQHASINGNLNYLLGEVSDHGWWYYFPLAFLVKTPLATLAAFFLATLAAIFLPRNPSHARDPWTAICLLLPIALYLAAAMSSDLNHGVRHLLPIFPMIFVSVAVVFSRAVQLWPRSAKTIGAALLIGLAGESLSAYPDFIPFFNLAAGGSRGGLALLGDSNLDWGQDLTLVATWQHEHPDVRLYLAYFGQTDPARLGIRYINLPSGYWLGPPATLPDPSHPGVLAISASILQGIYVRPPWDAMYTQIQKWKVRQVLGGSIYLYDFPPPGASQHK